MATRRPSPRPLWWFAYRRGVRGNTSESAEASTRSELPSLSLLIPCPFFTKFAFWYRFSSKHRIDPRTLPQLSSPSTPQTLPSFYFHSPTRARLNAVPLPLETLPDVLLIRSPTPCPTTLPSSPGSRLQDHHAHTCRSNFRPPPPSVSPVSSVSFRADAASISRLVSISNLKLISTLR